MKKRFLPLLLIVFLICYSCWEDNDDNLTPASTSSINDFIWRGLNFFYLYKADTPELADDAFATNDEYNTFLNGFDTPESFFDYLKSNQDRFSILVDDYIALENALGGTTETNGMEFGLVFYPDGSGNVFGYVRYVLPNTSASQAGLERGMIFNRIDGTQITENNFNDLLSPSGYTIGLATFDGQTVTPTNETVGLVKEQYTENPVHIVRTLDINGQKIGYLMYNAFTNEFDPQLNNAFAQFQADGVTDLVIDLRYNGGGSVETAVDLGAMVTGQFSGDVFYTEQWNADRQAEYAGAGLFNTSISTGDAINSLNLNEVYFLTTRRSASASELVINGLDAHINTVKVGDTTTGKFQASFLLYDAPAPNFSRTQANPNHTYAMLPLVFKTANKNGVTDFVDGLPPDVLVEEDYANLGQLGDPNEPLLAAAIAEITGVPAPRPRASFVPLKTVSESKAFSPAYQIMYVDGNR
ncbi:S41 family peptidase [Aureisphaera galaxeae]|uniref:S41 family peptidase n=1 Tax=Aureisphaera galaxeae TaxID=1538023 RepID=UPI0023506D7E|nr:S41 family peptidase [Aureisphaera galaxeae]MDC8003693.1 S41 family peptidase [Aureisphaera galaxeae]